MGLFDFFSRDSSIERKRAACHKKLTNMYYQKVDRLAAAEQAAELIAQGDEASIPVLLARFEHLCPNTTSDREEKEYVLNLLVDLGDKIIEPVKAYVRRASQPVYWPMRVLEHLLDNDTWTSFLQELLEAMDNGYHRDPERKLGLLQLAVDAKTEGVEAALLPFLDDHHEPVRHQAVEALAMREQPHPAALEALARRLTAEEDSVRVQSRVAALFLERSWVVSPTFEATSLRLPSGVRLSPTRTLTRS